MVQIKKMNANMIKVNNKVVEDMMSTLSDQNAKPEKKLERLGKVVQKMNDAIHTEMSKKKKTLSAYQQFMRDNYDKVSRQITNNTGEKPSSKEVLGQITNLWSAKKAQAQA